MFWKPTIAVESDVASFMLEVAAGMQGYKCDPDWISMLRNKDIDKETANRSVM